jgi:N-methylhydantoinase A
MSGSKNANQTGAGDVVRVAIDTGGTFTDCVFLREGRLVALKVMSTPDDPGRAVLDALQHIGGARGLVVRHGTTVGTNALLERKGARIAFVTTAGFEDTLAIGRQARAKLYDWFQDAAPCLAPAELRFGIRERVSAAGEKLVAAESAELDKLVESVRAANVEAVAISLLFSFLNPENEQALAASLRKLGLPLSVSHRILPEFREYERASTVAVNAYLAPKVGAYLASLAEGIEARFQGGRLEVMQSSGGMIPARAAAEEPVRTVLSGPAGGVVGAYRLASAAGFEKIIAFDMGGTSTDVSLVDGTSNGLRISTESVISGVPVAVPMLDIYTAGAGGGSIARFDAGNMLRVGPESAGSVPGPICFGRGELPTVTDANLILGRLDPGSFLDGAVPLDEQRTRDCMEQAKGLIATVVEFAAGIVDVVESSMAKAVRIISVEKGYDPREFTLVAFGGGGPLHACKLARTLNVPRVLVPALPGALSAVGILLADTVREYSRTVMLPIDTPLNEAFLSLEQRADHDFAQDGLAGAAIRSVDLRYAGQGYEINVPSGADMTEHFHAIHNRRYGFSAPGRAIEVVNLRVRMVAKAPPFKQTACEVHAGNGVQAIHGMRPVWFDGERKQTRIYRREELRPGDTFVGPAIVTEYTSATVVPPGDVVRVDGFHNLVIEVQQ